MVCIMYCQEAGWLGGKSVDKIQIPARANRFGTRGLLNDIERFKRRMYVPRALYRSPKWLDLSFNGWARQIMFVYGLVLSVAVGLTYK